MKSISLVFILLATSMVTVAQINDSISSSDSYIEKYDNSLSLKLNVNTNIEIFEVFSNADNYIIFPNNKLNTKLSINYRFIAFSLGFSPKFLPGNDDDDRKGTSKISSLGFDFNFKHWIQNVSYNRIKGFYLDNTSDYLPDWNSDTDAYIQFPELKFTNFSGFTGYKFNSNFSLKSLSSQTERQLKSAGSLIPLISYRYYIMDNQVELTGQNSSQKSNNFEGILQLGYFYTYVMNKKFYSNAGLALGGGIISSKLLTRLPSEEIKTKETYPIFRSEAQIAMGYNSERLFAGLQAIGRWEEYSQGNGTSTIVNDALTYQIFIGYRFNAPKSLIRLTDKIPIKQ